MGFLAKRNLSVVKIQIFEAQRGRVVLRRGAGCRESVRVSYSGLDCRAQYIFRISTMIVFPSPTMAEAGDGAVHGVNQS